MAARHSWPRLERYVETLRFRDVEPELVRISSLECLRPEYPDDLGDPLALPGGFAWVFPMVDEAGTRQRALKVFKRPVPERLERYPKIVGALDDMRRQGCSSVLPTEFHAEGLQIAVTDDSETEWFPAVVLQWTDAVRLDEYLDDHLQRGDEVRGLAYAWLDVLDEWRGAGVAHGDLQHGNILVGDDGKIVLIDYDGMYVPSMGASRLALERGVPGYQPPSRATRADCPLDARLDEFSALTILVTLATATPELWDFHERDSLILQEDDLIDPERSAVLRQMREMGETARALVECLLRAIGTDTTHTEELATAAAVLGRPLADHAPQGVRASTRRRRRRGDETVHLEWGPPDLVAPPARDEHLPIGGTKTGDDDGGAIDRSSTGSDGAHRVTPDREPAAESADDTDSTEAARDVDAASPSEPHLTHLERLTLVALMRGRELHDIATAGNVQERTVRERVARVRRKFSATSTEDLLTEAQGIGLTISSFNLTPRQREVLAGRVHGQAFDEIAQDLGVRRSTVERHLARALERLDVANEHDAIVAALVVGELEQPPKSTPAPALDHMPQAQSQRKAKAPPAEPAARRPPEPAAPTIPTAPAATPTPSEMEHSWSWLIWMIAGAALMLIGAGQFVGEFGGSWILGLVLVMFGSGFFERGRDSRRR